MDDHLSWTPVARRLTRPTRKHDGPPYRFLFGLAPDGVYMALSVTREAVSSYPAFSPLPANRLAVYFCCTFLGVASTGRYPASCPLELGLSSQAAFRLLPARSSGELIYRCQLLYTLLSWNVNPHRKAAPIMPAALPSVAVTIFGTETCLQNTFCAICRRIGFRIRSPCPQIPPPITTASG